MSAGSGGLQDACVLLNLVERQLVVGDDVVLTYVEERADDRW